MTTTLIWIFIAMVSRSNAPPVRMVDFYDEASCKAFAAELEHKSEAKPSMSTVIGVCVSAPRPTASGPGLAPPMDKGLAR